MGSSLVRTISLIIIKNASDPLNRSKKERIVDEIIANEWTCCAHWLKNDKIEVKVVDINS